MTKPKYGQRKQRAIDLGTNSGADLKAYIVVGIDGAVTVYGNNKVADHLRKTKSVPSKGRFQAPIQVTGTISSASWAASASLVGKKYKENYHLKAKLFGFAGGVVGVMVLK